MNWIEWYDRRGLRFISSRGSSLLARYGLAPGKVMQRIGHLMGTLEVYHCAPTFPTPGSVVQRYPDFIRSLQDRGAEIAVHGFQHVNLNAYPIQEAVAQLERAARTFERLGVEVHGFRCPYIGCSSELLETLPQALFEYSSNQAIYWELPELDECRKDGVLYDTLNKFYVSRRASDTVCVPSIHAKFTEIPVCIPDDLQLHDGLQLGVEGTAQAWKHILQQTHRRGELFTLLFHTELAPWLEPAFAETLTVARQLTPPVWVARLRDIREWWQDKSRFRVQVIPLPDRLQVSFDCSPRATLLARGVATSQPMSEWDGAYRRLKTPVIEVAAEPRPFVGLPADAPASVRAFLQEQGYILETGETARQCGIYLDGGALDRLANQVQLIEYIEASDAPLVRYGRWPDGAKSALSVTGDLDALSLLDYLSRLRV